MEKSQSFYVYRHIRNDTNMPFYVGIGSTPYRYKTPKNRTTWWNNIANKHGFVAEIIMDGLTPDEAFEKEKEFIELYGRMCKKEGTLVNMSIGGSASGLGVLWTQERKDIKSKIFSGINNPMFGRKRTDLPVYMIYHEEKRKAGVVKFNKEIKSIPVIAKEVKTGVETIYPSQREASRQLKLDQSRIYLVLKGKAKTTGGYTFKTLADNGN